MDLDEYQRDNQANWNDRAAVHATSDSYGLHRFVDDPEAISQIIQFDAPLIGDVRGLRIAHLQCHIGTDTISLARLGAEVVGVDFSPAAIEIARTLSTNSGTPVEFVLANVYDAAKAIGGTVDFVYTSVGTICWLSDIDRWAAAVADLLEPGGQFYIRDGHPYLWIWEEVDGELRPTYDYWTEPDAPLSWNDAETYTDGDHSTIINTRHHEWNHSLPDIVNALVSNGMYVDRMAEHQGLDWPLTPAFELEGDQWFFPEPLRSKVPAMFSLWATKSS